MSTLYNSCFFCGNICQNDNHEDGHISDSIDSFDDNSIINGEAAKKCILQISHYLQVAKSEMVRESVDEFSLLTICNTCWDISGKLSDFCVELEVIQMKILHFLNLLSDQILTNTSGAGTRHSTFQKSFNKKCLSKLASIEVYPELRLTKYQLPEQQDEHNSCNLLEDFNDNVDCGEDSNSVNPNTLNKVVSEYLKRDKTTPKFNCNLCAQVLNTLSLLQKHKKAVHSAKQTRFGHKIKSCEYCGIMTSTANLNRHKRKIHGVIIPILRGSLEGRKMKRCTICRKLISVNNISRHENLCGNFGSGQIQIEKVNEDRIHLIIKEEVEMEDCQSDEDAGLVTDEDLSNPQISPVPNDVEDGTTVDIKFETNLENSSSYKISDHVETEHPENMLTEQIDEKKLPCGLCGALVSSKKLKYHKRLCRKEKKLTVDSKKRKCIRCGKVFANNSSLTRHLRQNEICGYDIDRKNAEFKERFECSSCHRRFSQRVKMNRHLVGYCKNGRVIDHGGHAEGKKSELISN